MHISYNAAAFDDIDCIYRLCKKLIDDYENIESIAYDSVLKWIKRKIETHINEYTAVYVNNEKGGYYHFYKNENGEYELDDLYIFPKFQNRGIGSTIIERCCTSVNQSVFLYVFIKNERAVKLYKNHGFEIVNLVNNSRYIMKRNNRRYYEAYEERYKTIHSKGLCWSSTIPTPIVSEILKKYRINQNHKLLEIGCGEGRDSFTLLKNGYLLTATDISEEAIFYCKKQLPQYASNFSVLNCLSDSLKESFDFIFGIAVVHMLVLDNDRDGFYRFIRNHLNDNGIALICTMCDGEFEMQSDVSEAFNLKERQHDSGKISVAATSCRMVAWSTFENEIKRNELKIIEKGLTSSLPDFNNLMYAVVKKEADD